MADGLRRGPAGPAPAPRRRCPPRRAPICRTGWRTTRHSSQALLPAAPHWHPRYGKACASGSATRCSPSSRAPQEQDSIEVPYRGRTRRPDQGRIADRPLDCQVRQPFHRLCAAGRETLSRCRSGRSSSTARAAKSASWTSGSASSTSSPALPRQARARCSTSSTSASAGTRPAPDQPDLQHRRVVRSHPAAARQPHPHRTAGASPRRQVRHQRHARSRQRPRCPGTVRPPCQHRLHTAAPAARAPDRHRRHPQRAGAGKPALPAQREPRPRRPCSACRTRTKSLPSGRCSTGKTSAASPESLKATIPYFLGAVPEDQAALQQQLTQAKRALRRAENDLKAAQEANQGIEARLESLIGEARVHGLLTDSSVDTSDRAAVIEVLRQAASFRPTPDNADEEQRRQELLLTEQASALRRQLRSLAEERQLLNDLEKQAAGYTGAVARGMSRLSALNLVPDGFPGKRRLPSVRKRARRARPHRLRYAHHPRRPSRSAR